MNKRKKNLEARIKELYNFRARIPANLSKDKVKEVWGIQITEDNFPEVVRTREKIIEEKMKISKDLLQRILFKPFVRFVAISGSIASEFANEGDDIDLFVVTKNDTVWIYRFYIYLKNLFKNKIRSKDNPEVKNKLCINFLVEERALNFEGDIFNLNEILYLKPLYNEKFLKVIYLNNPWLKEKYMVSENFLGLKDLSVGDVKSITKRNLLLMLINFIAFLSQYIFMLLMRHQPDIKRLIRGYKSGRIEFYPKDFKKEKLERSIGH